MPAVPVEFTVRLPGPRLRREIAMATGDHAPWWAPTGARSPRRTGPGAGWGRGLPLHDLATVVTALLVIYDPAAVPGWIHGNNPHLSDRRPLDVLAAGDLAAVMAAVQATRTGAYA